MRFIFVLHVLSTVQLLLHLIELWLVISSAIASCWPTAGAARLLLDAQDTASTPEAASASGKCRARGAARLGIHPRHHALGEIWRGSRRAAPR
jgi:hypothetical protein